MMAAMPIDMFIDPENGHADLLRELIDGAVGE